MNEASVFIKEAPEHFLPAGDNTENTAVCGPTGGPSPDTESAGLQSQLPSLQNCDREVSVPFMPPRQWYSVITAPKSLLNAFPDRRMEFTLPQSLRHCRSNNAST